MKKLLFLGASGILLFCATSLSFGKVSTEENTSSKKENAKERLISFKLRGTGSKGIYVKIGVGSKVGTGSCCRTVSPSSTVSFTGHEGDVVYDSERGRVILKVYSGLEGTTTDLKEYY